MTPKTTARKGQRKTRGRARSGSQNRSREPFDEAGRVGERTGNDRYPKDRYAENQRLFEEQQKGD